jgi:hypothetical protein
MLGPFHQPGFEFGAQLRVQRHLAVLAALVHADDEDAPPLRALMSEDDQSMNWLHPVAAWRIEPHNAVSGRG